jgi:hypothetical protein
MEGVVFNRETCLPPNKFDRNVNATNASKKTEDSCRLSVVTMSGSIDARMRDCGEPKLFNVLQSVDHLDSNESDNRANDWM